MASGAAISKRPQASNRRLDQGSSEMTLEIAHKRVGAVMGELSLNLVVKKGSREALRRWASTLHDVANFFEDKAGE